MRVATTTSKLVLTAALAVVFVFSAAPVRDARADDPATIKQLKKMAREAMEYYDLMEVEDAKKQLNRAIALAKRKRMNDHPLTAQLYLHLGIVYFSGFQDVESAKVAFIDAVSIQPNILLNPAYKTGEMEKLLETARKEFTDAGSGGGGSSGGGSDSEPEAPASDGVDCDGLVGVAHTLVDSADAATDKPVKAHVSADLGADKVALYYRSQGKTDFVEVAMKKQGTCAYVGTVPGEAMNGEVVHYYVAVFNKGGKVIAKKGSSASPNIIELVASSGGSVGSAGDGGDRENPLGGGTRRFSGDEETGGSLGGGVGGGGSSTKSIYISLVVGSGGGYVSGQTEQARQEVSCCFAPALFHVFPEIGYRLDAKSSIGLAARFGLPIGADLPGHATAAPAGMVIYRRAFAPDGGLEANAGIGGGIIRQTVPLAGDMGTDTSAIGPLFIGAGVGYNKPLSGAMAFIAGLNFIAGIPITSEIGTSPANFGVQVDANMGLQIGF